MYSIYIWVNYNDLIATSLVTIIMVNTGNHPQVALI